MPERLAETAGELFPAEKYISGGGLNGKKLIICCTHGTNSIPLAERFAELGYDAVSLKGGYISWLLYTMGKQEQTDICADVEKSLRKKFHKKIWCTSQRLLTDTSWLRKATG